MSRSMNQLLVRAFLNVTLICAPPFCPAIQAQACKVEISEPMREPRAAFTATLLSDGTILVVGGATDLAIPFDTVLASSEIYGRGGSISTGSLHKARFGHKAVLLKDGDVLILGGSGDSKEPVREIEVYDPKSKKFEIVGLLPKQFQPGPLVPRPKGGFWIIGGFYKAPGAPDSDKDVRTTEVWAFYDGRLSLEIEPLQIARLNHTATPFLGRIVVAGGINPSESLCARDKNKSTGKIDQYNCPVEYYPHERSDPPLLTHLEGSYSHRAISVSGTLLFRGGFTDGRNAQVLERVNGTLRSVTIQLKNERYGRDAHMMVTLGTDRVMAVSGVVCERNGSTCGGCSPGGLMTQECNGPAAGHPVPLQVATEIYDAKTQRIVDGPTLKWPHQDGAALSSSLNRISTVFIVGGYFDLRVLGGYGPSQREVEKVTCNLN